MAKKKDPTLKKMTKAQIDVLKNTESFQDRFAKLPAAAQEQVKSMMKNSLSEAIMGFNPGQYGTQLNQANTLFINNRWYLVSNMRQLLSEIYVEHGLVQTIVDVPVDDGMRGGVEIKSKQLAPEQIEEVLTYLERENILSASVGQALKWNRLFGGAAVLIITNQDPKTPLNMNQINNQSPLEFRAIDMWELYYDLQNTEGQQYDPTTQLHTQEFYSYYGVKVHKSRVMIMKGLTAPSFIRPRLRGWGYSVVEALVNSINQYLKSNNLAFEVLDEFKVDVFKIANLTQTLLSADGTQLIQKRIALANQQKNFQNSIAMDGEDDYIQKQLSFSGLAEMMKEIRMQIASDMRMPLTKIFGISASGFNSGEDDIENYNAMVESQVRAKSKYDILRIIELVCQKLFGYVPTDLSVTFKPLRIMSSKEEQEVKDKKIDRLMKVIEKGLCTAKEAKEAINKGELLDIQLDTSVDQLLDGNEDEENEGGDEADESEDSSGSEAALTKKPRERKEAKDSKADKKTEVKEAKDHPSEKKREAR